MNVLFAYSQEITKCPFRVVDEINQGMDPKNERMVFETIARCGFADQTPQYLMITPKLLPDLPFPAEATIFCVLNGEHVLPQREWKYEQIITAEAHRKSASQAH